MSTFARFTSAGAALFIAALLLIPMLGACSSGEQKRPVIAVSTPQQEQLLRYVVADDFKIVTLLPLNADPETSEPSMTAMAELQNCSMYLNLNTPGFEYSMVKQIKSNFPEIAVADVSRTINPISGTHGDSSSFDPHYLNSLRNARLIASRMKTKLTQRYPQFDKQLSANAALLDDSLRRLDDSVTRMLHPLYGRSFVVFHPSLSYFARDYGLRQISLMEEGKESSPKQFMERLDMAAKSKPILLFYEKGGDEQRAKQVADELAIPAVEINLNSPNFSKNVMQVARELSSRQ